LCAILVEDNSFTSTFNKRTHTISDEMSCNSINTIYLITCTKCKFQYVGETGRTLRERFNNHRSDIKLHKNTAISIHFNDILHSYKNLSMIPIETISDTVQRKGKESYWIFELDTYYPRGINNYPIDK